jgi:hypothetical protein
MKQESLTSSAATDMVPRSRLNAVEAELTEAKQELARVRSAAHAEITRLEKVLIHAVKSPPPPAEPALPKLTDERIDSIVTEIFPSDGDHWHKEWLAEVARPIARAIEQELRPPASPQREINARDWWCPTCRKSVPPEHVTYEEIHDPVAGGCGNAVNTAAPSGPPVAEMRTQLPEKARAGIEVLHRVVERLLTTASFEDEEGDETFKLAELLECIADPPLKLNAASSEPSVEAPSAEVWGVVHRETGRIDMVSEDEAGATYCYTEGYEKRKGIAYFPPPTAGIASTRRGEQ